MLSRILSLLVAVVFFTALVAPFTFMKPPVVEVIQEAEQQALMVDNKSVKTLELDLLPEQIEPAEHSEKIPNFSAIYDVSEKKQAFFNYLRPVVQAENAKVRQVRNNLKIINDVIENSSANLSASVHTELKALAKYYRVDAKLPTKELVNQLLVSVDEIPEELVLVQAANESAWGTSRFARVGLNFFGLWCYKKGCGLVPNGREEGATHEVEKFSTLEQAIARYFKYINSSRNYKALRETRAQFRATGLPVDASLLASGLLPYSERGAEYVAEIQSMLRHNQHFFEYAE